MTHQRSTSTEALYWPGFHVLAWVGRVSLATGLVLASRQGDVGAMVTLLVFLLISLAGIGLGRYFPSIFDFLVTLAALLNTALWLWDDRFLFFYDEIVHMYTPFTIALALGFQAYYRHGAWLRGQRAFFAAIIVSFGIAIGAIWEIAEWTSGFVVAGTVIGSLDDTIHDLMADSVGAAAAGFLASYPLNGFLEQDRARRQPLRHSRAADVSDATSK